MNRLTESTWKAIRHEYQTTKTTCRALSEKYGVNRETVSSRCKLEKWRHGRPERKKTCHKGLTQLGRLSPPDAMAKRVLLEAEQWLDRIQEAYEQELRYDRVEAIQKLLPQWRTAVDQIQKFVPDSPARPMLSLDLRLRDPFAIPPRINFPILDDAGNSIALPVESLALP